MADDGCLHVVAERGSIRDALARLDLPRARLLTRLSLFWVRRVRCGLSTAVMSWCTSCGGSGMQLRYGYGADQQF